MGSIRRPQVARLLLAAAALLLGASCSHGGPMPAQTRLVGGLTIDGSPQDAEVYVDDRYVGAVAAVSKRAVPIAEGVHRIEIRRDGYFSSYHEIKVVQGIRQRLRVVLKRIPFSGGD